VTMKTTITLTQKNSAAIARTFLRLNGYSHA
jgi:hypothetical protein